MSLSIGLYSEVWPPPASQPATKPATTTSAGAIPRHLVIRPMNLMRDLRVPQTCPGAGADLWPGPRRPVGAVPRPRDAPVDSTDASILDFFPRDPRPDRRATATCRVDNRPVAVKAT